MRSVLSGQIQNVLLRIFAGISRAVRRSSWGFDTFSKPFKIDKYFLSQSAGVCLAPHLQAEVAELADAHGSGPCTRKGVGVRVPSSAPDFLSSIIEPLGVRETPALVLSW